MGVIILLGAIVGGGVLYRLRSRHRLWYGIGELVVGVVVLFLTEFPQGPVVVTTDQPPPFLAPLATWAGLAGGIYILVRGLDNIDNDLPARWRATWDRVFRKPLR